MIRKIVLSALVGLFVIPLANAGDEGKGQPAQTQTQEQGERGIASDQRVFTQDYLESIKDEEAAEQLKKDKLARDHEKYLRHLDRTARSR